MRPKSREQLAESNPAAFLPDLAMSLNNLARRLADGGDAEAAARAFDAGAAKLADAAARAIVLVAKARWSVQRDDVLGAARDLGVAAIEAQAEGSDPRLLGEARRALRGAVRVLAQDATAEVGERLGELPAWAGAPIDESHVERITAWARCTSWPEEEAFLREHRDTLMSAEFEASLALLADLYPGDRPLQGCRGHLRALQAEGFDVFLATQAALHERMSLLRDWMATRTWDESREFMKAWRERLQAPELEGLLATTSADDAVAHQHLAILGLCRTRLIDDVFDIVTDTTAAADAAMATIEHGHADDLRLLVDAHPALARVEFVGSLLATVLALLGDQGGEATAHARQAAEQAGPVQRKAAAIRLRRLGQARPELAKAVSDLATVFEATAAPQPPVAGAPSRHP